MWYLLKKDRNDEKISSKDGEKGEKSGKNWKNKTNIKRAVIKIKVDLKVGLMNIKSENSKNRAVNSVNRGIK